MDKDREGAQDILVSGGAGFPGVNPDTLMEGCDFVCLEEATPLPDVEASLELFVDPKGAAIVEEATQFLDVEACKELFVDPKEAAIVVSSKSQKEDIAEDDVLQGVAAGLGVTVSFVGSLSLKVEPPLLTTPYLKTVLGKTRTKKANTEANSEPQRKSTRIANKPKTNLSMEAQATQLLMKKSGMWDEDPVPSHAAQEKFTHQFVSPLKNVAVKGFCENFGIGGADGADPLSAIAIEAEA